MIADHRDVIYDRLNYFAGLEDNWDGYGAKVLTDASFETLVHLARHLPGKPLVFPTPKGGGQFEYEWNDNYFEVEIEPDGTAGFLWMEGFVTSDPNNAQLLEVDDVDLTLLVGLATKFIELYDPEAANE